LNGQCVAPCQGARLHQSKALDAFDYFNAIICYTLPLTYQQGKQGFGTLRCRQLSVDDATGTILTMPAGNGLEPTGTGLMSNVAVTTMKPKSGDPTRALFCYMTQTVSQRPPRTTQDLEVAYNVELRCNVAQRSGGDLTYLNGARTASGQASAGVNVDVGIAATLSNPGRTSTPAGAIINSYIMDTTLVAMDETNAIVCYANGTDGGNCLTGGCGSPAFPGINNGITVPRADGDPTCHTITLHGEGSSTYNSNVFNGISSATAPVNVGSVNNITVGFATKASADGGGYLAMASQKTRYQVLCYAKTTRTPVSATNDLACQLILPTFAENTWHFNNDVDCVNGYGCAQRRLSGYPDADKDEPMETTQ